MSLATTSGPRHRTRTRPGPGRHVVQPVQVGGKQAGELGPQPVRHMASATPG